MCGKANLKFLPIFLSSTLLYVLPFVLYLLSFYLDAAEELKAVEAAPAVEPPESKDE